MKTTTVLPLGAWTWVAHERGIITKIEIHPHVLDLAASDGTIVVGKMS
jgi:hypothetical protein